MRLRITALWVIPVALIATGFGSAWGAAVGSAARYNDVSITSALEFDWTSVAGIVAEPLILAGLLAVLVALAVHAVLWRPAR